MTRIHLHTGRVHGAGGGSFNPDPDLQRLALHLPDLMTRIRCRFSLTLVRAPRDLSALQYYTLACILDAAPPLPAARRAPAPTTAPPLPRISRSQAPRTRDASARRTSVPPSHSETERVDAPLPPVGRRGQVWTAMGVPSRAPRGAAVSDLRICHAHLQGGSVGVLVALRHRLVAGWPEASGGSSPSGNSPLIVVSTAVSARDLCCRISGSNPPR